MSSFIEKANLILVKVKLTDKLFFTKNLNLMIRSGIPIVEALKSLSAQSDNVKFKLILSELQEHLQKGESLSRAMEAHPKVFPEIFVNMIRAGEESGKLEDVLQTLTTQLYKEHDLKSKVKGALAYPVIVLIATFGITCGLIVFVVPKLTQMFSESGLELPLSTKILIALSTFAVKYFYLAIGLVVGLVLAFLRFRKTRMGKRILHKIILISPILGYLAKKFNLARAMRTLSALLSTDIPVVNSFLIASNVINNIYYKEALCDISEKLKTGVAIHKAFEQYANLFPPTILQMVSVGEETGKLDEILNEIANFYEDDLDTILKNLPSLLEPVLILILGVTVGGIALAIMTPIFTFTRGAAEGG